MYRLLRVLKIWLLLSYLSCTCMNVFAQAQVNVITSEYQRIECIGGLILPEDVPFQEVREMVDSFYWWGIDSLGKKPFYRNRKFEPAHSYWWHIYLNNETNEIEDWVIKTGRRHLSNIYTIENDTFTHKKSGELINYSEKSYPLDNDVFAIKILPCEQAELFVKKTNYYGGYYSKDAPNVDISSTKYHQEETIPKKRPDFSRLFEFAFLFVAFFLSAFTFLQLLIHRDKAYAYYAFYLLMVACYFLYQYESTWGHPILFAHFYKYRMLMEPPMTYGFILVYGLFAQSFVAFNSPARKGMGITIKYLKYVVCIALFTHSIAAVFHDYNTLFSLSHEIRQVLFFFTLPILYFMLINRSILSYIFLAGTLVLLLGVSAIFWVEISYTIQDIFRLPRSTTSIVQIAMLLEFLCFSTALGYKTKLTQDENTRIERELSVTELKALKAQLNPHFIFNCLTSIKNLVIKNDNEAADNYLQHFAKLIRSILVFSEKQSITLKEELEVSDLYLKMESLRFNHSFEYKIDIEDGIDTENIRVPALIFQPYLENAIHHGLRQKEGQKHLKIEIYEQEEKIICAIDDNGVGREAAVRTRTPNAHDTPSFGMRLTQERIDKYSAFIGDDISVKVIDKAQGTRVELQIQESSPSST